MRTRTTPVRTLRVRFSCTSSHAHVRRSRSLEGSMLSPPTPLDWASGNRPQRLAAAPGPCRGEKAGRTPSCSAAGARAACNEDREAHVTIERQAAARPRVPEQAAVLRPVALRRFGRKHGGLEPRWRQHRAGCAHASISREGRPVQLRGRGRRRRGGCSCAARGAARTAHRSDKHSAYRARAVVSVSARAIECWRASLSTAAHARRRESLAVDLERAGRGRHKAGGAADA